MLIKFENLVLEMIFANRDEMTSLNGDPKYVTNVSLETVGNVLKIVYHAIFLHRRLILNFVLLVFSNGKTNVSEQRVILF